MLNCAKPAVFEHRWLAPDLLSVGAAESMATEPNAATGDLRYLEAHNVRYPQGTLADLDLCTTADEKLGVIEGVLIDPAHRRVRYYVIESPGWFRVRHYLLPADAPAVVESDERVLRVEAPAADLTRREYDPASTPRFSDADLLTAMFPPHAA